jgi:pimeloyl-ACP methyl ester carboxylesterase
VENLKLRKKSESAYQPHYDPVMKISRKIYSAILIVLSLICSCVSIEKQPTTWQDYMADTMGKEPLELHYEAYGQGKPVIFLHGLGGSLYTWRHLVGPLAPHYRLIVFDLKGAGKSPKPFDDKYSMFDQAELIYRFIRQNDMHDLTLVGHSFGGGVALLVALKLSQQNPSRLSRLILIDTVSYPQKLPGVIRMLRMPLVGWLGLYLIPDKTKVRNMMESMYYDDSRINPADVEAYAAPLTLPGAKYALRQTARQIIPDNIDEIIGTYPRIKVPTLIIWGREDKIIPLENGVRLHHAISTSQLVVIERCGHDPPDERPEEVEAAIVKFLANHGHLFQ